MQPQNQPIMQAPVAVSTVKKCNHLPIIIILAILAVAGLGFGGYELFQNIGKEKQIFYQKTIIEQYDKKIADLQAEVDNSQNDNSNPVTEEAEDQSDYIYIGEWNIKIKKPEESVGVISEYEYRNGYPQAANQFTIIEDSESNQQMETQALILIYELTNSNCNDWMESHDDTCITIGDKSIAINASPYVSQSFRDFFTNQANYSAIK